MVSAKHDIDPLLQGSELLRDTLPSLPAHEYHVRLCSGCVRRDLTKVCQVFWDVPRHHAAPTNAILLCCGDNEGKPRHGGTLLRGIQYRAACAHAQAPQPLRTFNLWKMSVMVDRRYYLGDTSKR